MATAKADKLFVAKVAVFEKYLTMKFTSHEAAVCRKLQASQYTDLFLSQSVSSLFFKTPVCSIILPQGWLSRSPPCPHLCLFLTPEEPHQELMAHPSPTFNLWGSYPIYCLCSRWYFTEMLGVYSPNKLILLTEIEKLSHCHYLLFESTLLADHIQYNQGYQLYFLFSSSDRPNPGRF